MIIPFDNFIFCLISDRNTHHQNVNEISQVKPEIPEESLGGGAA